MVKMLVLVAATVFAAGLFASPATYNDLGDQAGSETAFWNNASHPLVQVDTSATVLDFDFDTWYKTEDWDISEIFTGLQGLLLLFR